MPHLPGEPCADPIELPTVAESVLNRKPVSWLALPKSVLVRADAILEQVRPCEGNV
jgi:hypothetical protein